MLLIKDGRIVDDVFAVVGDDEPVPEGSAIVSLARFQRDREALLARNAPLGVRFRSDESPEALGDDLPRLSIVVLEFAKFRDGRPFSWARMLRTRFGFEGEIRASGNFLYDQIAFMRRVGFSAFEAGDSITPEAVQRALSEMSFVYQPGADGRMTIHGLRHRR